ncbi:MAG: hypothetical protein M1308_05160 [Actinobacteria bacterium]|nr:hypothetical protein [Actinomycetota bacterium]MCL5070269.1 hypothetical protein [Actinomycetota bacterium]
MLKSKNKEKARSKILSTATITFIFFMLMTFLIISSTSCSSILGGTTTAKTDVGTNQQGSSKEENTSSETSSQETIKEVDFATATIGAEIKGYIPSYMLTDKDNFIKIEITNTSDFTWRTDKPNLVRIGYHYYGQDVDFTSYDQTSRTVLPNEVKPGETVTVDVLINDIKNEGTYVIQIDPVMEGSNIAENNFWFSSKGVSMLEGTAYFGPSEN